jgi:hypothetical protein
MFIMFSGLGSIALLIRIIQQDSYVLDYYVRKVGVFMPLNKLSQELGVNQIEPSSFQCEIHLRLLFEMIIIKLLGVGLSLQKLRLVIANRR